MESRRGRQCGRLPRTPCARGASPSLHIESTSPPARPTLSRSTSLIASATIEHDTVSRHAMNCHRHAFFAAAVTRLSYRHAATVMDEWLRRTRYALCLARAMRAERRLQ